MNCSGFLCLLRVIKIGNVTLFTRTHVELLVSLKVSGNGLFGFSWQVAHFRAHS